MEIKIDTVSEKAFLKVFRYAEVVALITAAFFGILMAAGMPRQNQITIGGVSMAMDEQSPYHISDISDEGNLYDFQIFDGDKAVFSGQVKSYMECCDITEGCNIPEEETETIELEHLNGSIIEQNGCYMVYLFDQKQRYGVIGYSTANPGIIEKALRDIHFKMED